MNLILLLNEFLIFEPPQIYQSQIKDHNQSQDK